MKKIITIILIALVASIRGMDDPNDTMVNGTKILPILAPYPHWHQENALEMSLERLQTIQRLKENRMFIRGINIDIESKIKQQQFKSFLKFFTGEVPDRFKEDDLQEKDYSQVVMILFKEMTGLNNNELLQKKIADFKVITDIRNSYEEVITKMYERIIKNNLNIVHELKKLLYYQPTPSYSPDYWTLFSESTDECIESLGVHLITILMKQNKSCND